MPSGNTENIAFQTGTKTLTHYFLAIWYTADPGQTGRKYYPVSEISLGYFALQGCARKYDFFTLNLHIIEDITSLHPYRIKIDVRMKYNSYV